LSDPSGRKLRMALSLSTSFAYLRLYAKGRVLTRRLIRGHIDPIGTMFCALLAGDREAFLATPMSPTTELHGIVPVIRPRGLVFILIHSQVLASLICIATNQNLRLDLQKPTPRVAAPPGHHHLSDRAVHFRYGGEVCSCQIDRGMQRGSRHPIKSPRYWLHLFVNVLTGSLLGLRLPSSRKFRIADSPRCSLAALRPDLSIMQ
jgi:hypothetical protein